MKKLIVSLLLIASVTAMYAQRANVNRARNMARSENPNFAGARELIKPALQDESTKNLALTWFIAGEIGYRENMRLETQRYFNPGAFDQSKQGQIIMESINFFIVADSLDQLPDDRGRVRPRHRRDMRRMVSEYYQFGSLVGYGAYLFEKNDFVGALNAFNTFLAIPDLPLIEGSIPKDSTYYQIMFFAAISASSAENSDEAIRLFELLTTKDYETLAVFELLHREYSLLNDTVNYVRILKEGMDRFPSELWFIQQLINHYIYSEQPEKALEYLTTAIQGDPTLAQYRFVEGNLHEQLGNMEEAEAAYKKALELDPDLTTALEALGLFYFRRALAIDDMVFTIRDPQLRRQEEEKAANEFRRALPLFERLAELEPTEMRHKYRLRGLYNVLRMDNELEAISQEIERATQ